MVRKINRKINLIYLLILTLCLSLNAQNSKSNKPPVDTIYKVNKVKIPCNVKSITSSVVNFVFPEDDQVYSVERKDVYKIVYKNGKVEILNNLSNDNLSINNSENRKKEAMDTIYKLSNQKVPCIVHTITPTYVSFVYPGNDKVYTIERKEVYKIIYKNGKVELLNNPAVIVFDENSWEAVWITEDPKDVANLYKIKEIEVNSPSNSRSYKAAENGAIIRLKKRASALNGIVVLVTHKQRTGGYGDPPGYLIRGIVYGTQPPDDTSNSKLE